MGLNWLNYEYLAVVLSSHTHMNSPLMVWVGEPARRMLNEGVFAEKAAICSTAGGPRTAT